jgi:hypothetical protein
MTWTLGAFAIIFDEQNRVLLRHRQDMGAWNLPAAQPMFRRQSIPSTRAMLQQLNS